jgi:hypothetical protein
VLASYEHVHPGITIGRNPIGALVVIVISTSVRHGDGLAPAAALALRSLDWAQRREIRPFGL